MLKMAASINVNNSGHLDLSAIDQAAAELRVAILPIEAQAHRLLGDLFYSPNSARNGLRYFLKNSDAEEMIKVIGSDSFSRTYHFGATNDGLFGFFTGKRAKADAALRNLPEALRDLFMLHRKLEDLRTVQRKYGRPVFDDTAVTGSRVTGRSGARTRKP